MPVVVLAATTDAPVTNNLHRRVEDAGTNTVKAVATSDYALLAHHQERLRVILTQIVRKVL